MSGIESFATPPMWAGFVVFMLSMLALEAHRVAVKEAMECWRKIIIYINTLIISFSYFLIFWSPHGVHFIKTIVGSCR